MTWFSRKAIVWVVLLIAVATFTAEAAVCLAAESSGSSYLGFDRNDYPGDANLKALRQTFAYAGFWLNPPPGATTNNWRGKRRMLQSAGFGFLVLFNGRLYAELKNTRNAGKLGASDAREAIASARREGFPSRTILFLDQEQGGRMLPEQKAYIYTWVNGVAAAGFRAGIYCSGIVFEESPGVRVVTADDIRQHAESRKIEYWVTNDACPPSPGCAFPEPPPPPADSGIDFAKVWQFAQSPKRNDVAAGCPANYHADGSCYPPGIGLAQRLHVDVDTATSPDPSDGRTH
jgi:hypothetical protein